LAALSNSENCTYKVKIQDELPHLFSSVLLVCAFTIHSLIPLSHQSILFSGTIRVQRKQEVGAKTCVLHYLQVAASFAMDIVGFLVFVSNYYKNMFIEDIPGRKAAVSK